MNRTLAVDDAAWSSPWRLRAPGDKALLAGGLVLCGLLLPALPTSPVVAVVSVLLLVGPARVPAATVLRALRAPVAFVVLGAVSVALQVDPGAQWWLTTSGESITRAAEVAIHAVAGACAVMVLAATTPLSDVLPRLARAGVPSAVVEVAGVTYRLLFQLRDGVIAVREAQTARLGVTGWRGAVRSAGALAAAVLLRSWERARRLEQGLAGRGDGPLTVLVEERPSSARFVVVTLALLTAVAVAGLVAR